MIMAQQRCTATVAFDLLRAESQNTHRRVRDVAADLIARVTGQPPEPGRHLRRHLTARRPWLESDPRHSIYDRVRQRTVRRLGSSRRCCRAFAAARVAEFPRVGFAAPTT